MNTFATTILAACRITLIHAAITILLNDWCDGVLLQAVQSLWLFLTVCSLGVNLENEQEML